ncbi:MAG: xylulokinase [bacterium]
MADVRQIYLIGLDIGTTGVKGIVINQEGTTCASSTEEYPLSIPRPNWAEQNPEDWWNATVKVLKTLAASLGSGKSEIKAIGLSGQMHSLVLLDEQSRVLRPAILWCDTRTDKECNWINETIGEETLRNNVANPALEGFTLPKILWVREHEPEIYSRIAKVLLPKDYIRFRLSGEFATDVSDAAGTLMFDVAARRWSAPMLKETSIPSSWLPPVFESVDVVGKTTRSISEATGLPGEIPLVAGGADNACGAVGCGVVSEETILASIGTSGVVLAPSAKPRTDPEMRAHTFCHAVPKRWYIMGVTLMAGGALRWYKDTFSAGSTYDDLTSEAATVPAGSEGLFFLPYLNGERTPHRSASARGGFFGASMRHEKKHFSRSVLEGITYAMRDSLEIIRRLDIPIRQIRLTGGGAKSKFWRQLQADVYGSEVATVNSSEGPAFGAALMAGVGAGVYSNVAEAAARLVTVTETIQPSQESSIYNERYQIFTSLYPALKPTFGKIHQL